MTDTQSLSPFLDGLFQFALLLPLLVVVPYLLIKYLIRFFGRL